MNLDLNFLSYDQYGFDKLNIFEKRGKIAPITDFSIAMGGDVSDSFYYNNSINLKDRAGNYWGSSIQDYNYVDVVTEWGDVKEFSIDCKNIGARPYLNYSLIRNQVSRINRASDGILEIEFGEYPQSIVTSDLLATTLETNLSLNNLDLTGKIYTNDLNHILDYDKEFTEQQIYEYEYNGKKYVRVQIKPHYNTNEYMFSNGEKHMRKEYIWIQVEPIKWLVDETQDIALSEKILFAGVSFFHGGHYILDFDYSDIKEFMDKYFSKEIIVNSNKINYEQVNNVTGDFIVNNNTNSKNTQPETNKENMSIDDAINEALFKMNEILGEENIKQSNNEIDNSVRDINKNTKQSNNEIDNSIRGINKRILMRRMYRSMHYSAIVQQFNKQKTLKK